MPLGCELCGGLSPRTGSAHSGCTSTGRTRTAQRGEGLQPEDRPWGRGEARKLLRRLPGGGELWAEPWAPRPQPGLPGQEGAPILGRAQSPRGDRSPQ